MGARETEQKKREENGSQLLRLQRDAGSTSHVHNVAQTTAARASFLSRYNSHITHKRSIAAKLNKGTTGLRQLKGGH
jgi:hypothetical protein